jgi:hypothetical protein
MSGTAGPSGAVSGQVPVTSQESNPIPGSPGTSGKPGTPVQQPRIPRLVDRRTGLRGLGIGAGRAPVRTVRKNTEDDLREKDPEIPYVKAEHAIRDLICSLMERQDRMNEEILQRVVDLQYRMDDLEGRMPARKIQKPGGSPEGSP